MQRIGKKNVAAIIAVFLLGLSLVLFELLRFPSSSGWNDEAMFQMIEHSPTQMVAAKGTILHNYPPSGSLLSSATLQLVSPVTEATMQGIKTKNCIVISDQSQLAGHIRVALGLADETKIWGVHYGMSPINAKVFTRGTDNKWHFDDEANVDHILLEPPGAALVRP